MFHVPARPLSGLHPFDAHLPGMVACSGYHRFTLPRRDTVMVATCVPRRNTTLVLDNPHARPIGSKTTTGFDTSRATPCRSGPGQQIGRASCRERVEIVGVAGTLKKRKE